ncbi:hypothetical protein I4U23_016485 [Adineta vaga]|nr:hypothetical protein I4U23_016485 [Adineta vaga]
MEQLCILADKSIENRNALISQIQFNWRFLINEENQITNVTFRIEPVFYINSDQNTSCTCATQQTCTMPGIMYDESSTKPLQGFKLGCYIFETVFLSSLSCLYSEICINDYRYFAIPFYAGYIQVEGGYFVND